MHIYHINYSDIAEQAARLMDLAHTATGFFCLLTLALLFVLEFAFICLVKHYLSRCNDAASVNRFKEQTAGILPEQARSTTAEVLSSIATAIRDTLHVKRKDNVPLALRWAQQAEEAEKRIINDTLNHPKYGMVAVIVARTALGWFRHTFFLPLADVINRLLVEKSRASALSRSFNNRHPANQAKNGASDSDNESEEDEEAGLKGKDEQQEHLVEIDPTRASPLPNEAFFGDPQERDSRLHKLQAQFEKICGVRLVQSEERGYLLLKASWRPEDLRTMVANASAN